MFKDIDPLVPLLGGVALLGMGLAFSNPNYRALFSQRNAAQQLQEAARIETMATQATEAIAANRQTCTRVPKVSHEVIYRLPAGAAICGGGLTATIGADGRPVLIAQEVK